jgi:hypothetical protein
MTRPSLAIRLDWLKRERLVTVQQFRDINRGTHIYAITNKRIVEIDYSGKGMQTVATLKQLKQAKKGE